MLLQFGFHDYIFIYIQRRETPIIIREYEIEPSFEQLVSTKVETEKVRTTTKTEPKTTTMSKLPIWQAIIFGTVLNSANSLETTNFVSHFMG